MTGHNATDILGLGPYTIPQQEFLLATEVDTRVFDNDPADGICGLGFPSLAEGNIIPPFDNLMKLGVLPANEFSFYLGGNPRNPNENSYLLLGGRDSTLTYSFAPVVSEYYWAVRMSAVNVSSGVLLCSSGCAALIDTGTSFIAVPSAAETALVSTFRKLLSLSILSIFESISDIQFDCSKSSLLPDITFTIASTEYTLSYDQYVYEIVSSSSGETLYCALAFQPFSGSQSTEAWVLGGTFLRAYTAVFDRQNNRIGFASTSTTQLTPAPPTPIPILSPSARSSALPLNVHTAVSKLPWVLMGFCILSTIFL